jgi:hypothetical protein
MRRLLIALLLSFMIPALVRAQQLPSFCTQVTPDQLKGTTVPYSARTAFDHSQYCEGQLTSATAAHPVEIVSFKQETGSVFSFSPGATASLSWCRIPGMEQSAHLSLRAIKPAIYALDAQPVDKFEWSSDVIGKVHPDYSSIAALAVGAASVNGKAYSVLLPVRRGPPVASDGYVFMVHSLSPVHLTQATIEPVSGAAQAESVPIAAPTSPAPHFLIVRLPFGDRAKGIYRISFGGDPTVGEPSTAPIYIVHGACQ